MEGTSLPSSKLKFVETKSRIKIPDYTKSQNQYKLISAANNHQLVYVGLPDGTIRYVKSSNLTIPSSDNAAQIAFRVPFQPSILTVARGGYSSVLLVIGNDGNCPMAEAFDIDKNISIGSLKITEAAGSQIVDYAWHPNYFNSIIALCSSTGNLLVLAINNGMSLVYNKNHGALTCCWSPKGKNLAIGKNNGQVMRLEPVITRKDFSFKDVDNSTITFTNGRMSPSHQLIKLRWINKTYLMSVHAVPSTRDAILSLITVKPSKPYRYWSNVFIEIPGPQNYDVSLVNFTNCVVCCSNSSSEVACIGFEGAKEAATNDLKDWHQIECDEGTTIVLPCNDDQQETLPLGVTVVKGDTLNLVFFTDDGILCCFRAHHDENILKLPEFQPEHPCPVDVAPAPPKPVANVPAPQSMAQALSKPFGQSSFSPAAPQQTFGSATSQTFGHSFGQASPLSFGQSFSQSLNQTLSQPFGQTSFSQASPLSFSQCLAQVSISSETSSNQQQQQATTQPITQPSTQTPTQFATQQSSLSFSQLAAETPPRQQQQASGQSLHELLSQTSAIASSQLSTQPSFLSQPLSQEPSQPVSQTNSDTTITQVQSQPPRTPKVPSFSEAKLVKEIQSIRSRFNKLTGEVSVLKQVNDLKYELDEVSEFLKTIEDALTYFEGEIQEFELSTLKRFHLLEYIKSRDRNESRHRSIDPITIKKVEDIKKKTKTIAQHMKDLEINVEVAREEFVRKNHSHENKDRRLRSLEMIYKALTMNQKIINILKKRLPDDVGVKKTIPKEPEYKPNFSCINRKELEPSKMLAFREFLASRSQAPIRRPE